jgi:hypothetical protein
MRSCSQCRWLRQLMASMAVVVLVGCSSGAATPPSTSSGVAGPCRVSPSRVAHSLAPAFGFGSAYGTDTVYALMEVPGGFKSSDGDKILWITAPNVRGSLALSGGAVDGGGVIQFGGPGNWKSTMKLNPNGRDWVGWPSSERFVGTGTCWQFRAVLAGQSRHITVPG